MIKPLKEYIYDGRRFLVFKNRENLYGYLFELWKSLYDDAFQKKGCFCVALSGGTTTICFYRKIALNKGLFNWEKIHLFLVDERYVPQNHSDSNSLMIRENLISRIPIPEQNIHFIPTDEDNPEKAAKQYEKSLRKFFFHQKKHFPQFDLVILGIGEDGHTASIFPGTLSLDEKLRLTIVTESPIPPRKRITLTLPVINNSKNVVFLVTGKNKSMVIKRISHHSCSDLPAALVKPLEGEVLLLLDKFSGCELIEM